MSNPQNDKVTAFLSNLAHSRKPEIERLRYAILGGGADLTEHIKWNAPSFCHNGDDRVTFRLQPADRVELIFHRGAKKRPDTASFVFTDHTGLVRWITPDRGVVVVDATDGDLRDLDIVALVEAWTVATRDT